MLNIGAQMYTAREFTQTAKDLRESLQKVKQIGYNAVQLSAQSADIPDEEIRAMLEELSLTCAATHLSFEQYQTNLPAIIQRHKLWGCAYPGVGAMPQEYSAQGAEGYRRFAKDASGIAKALKDEGLTFIYHNHSFEFVKFDGVLGMEILLNESDPALQFELDVYWAQAGGVNPVEWIDKLKGRMDVIHYKDMEIAQEGYGVKQLFAEIGNGNLNWHAIIEACHRTNVRWALIEQDTCKGSPFDSLRMSYEYLAKQGLQ